MGFRVQITVEGIGMPAEVVESRFDAIADALYDCTGISDQDLAADSSKAQFIFAFDVDSIDDPGEAVVFAVSVVRTALHAAGGATPNWEKEFRLIRQVSEPADRQPELV